MKKIPRNKKSHSNTAPPELNGELNTVLNTTVGDSPCINFNNITNLNEIGPNNKEIWAKIVGEKCEPLFCFVNARLVAPSPAAIQREFLEPDHSDHSDPADHSNDYVSALEPELGKIAPISYWCAAHYFPALEMWLFQYQNVIYIGNETVESDIQREWVTHRPDLFNSLNNFFELYEDHERIILNTRAGVSETSNITGMNSNLLLFYIGLVPTLDKLKEKYQQQYEVDGWLAHQVEYFTKLQKQMDEINICKA
jgi:hypothetical protein